jgi:hypothetical protein
MQLRFCGVLAPVAVPLTSSPPLSFGLAIREVANRDICQASNPSGVVRDCCTTAVTSNITYHGPVRHNRSYYFEMSTVEINTRHIRSS